MVHIANLFKRFIEQMQFSRSICKAEKFVDERKKWKVLSKKLTNEYECQNEDGGGHSCA